MAGKKKTGRTKQLSLKSTPEFHQRLKTLASEEKCLMIEILERALEVWEEQKRKEINQSIIREKVIPTKRNKRRLEDDEIGESDTKKRRFDQ